MASLTNDEFYSRVSEVASRTGCPRIPNLDVLVIDMRSNISTDNICGNGVKGCLSLADKSSSNYLVGA